VTENKAEGLVPHFPICLVKLSALLPYYHTFSFYIALELLKPLCVTVCCYIAQLAISQTWTWNILHFLCFT